MDAGQLALLIPIVAIASGAAVKIAKLKAQAGAGDPRIADRIASLEDEVDRLRQDLLETHERLDFTERMLAQQRSANLPPPGT